MKELKRVPELRFSEFNGFYEIHKLETLFGNISSGKSKSNSDGEYTFYGSTGIIGTSKQFDYEGEKLLVARVGANAGSLYKVKGRYCVSDNTLLINKNPESNIGFLYYSLVNFNLNRLIFGSGQPLITGGQ